MSHPSIIVAGAGLAGLAAARSLCLSGARITIVAPTAYAVLSPFVPGILSGWVCPWRPYVPLSHALPKADLRVGRIRGIDPARKTVEIEGPGVRSGCEPASVAYDALLVGAGAPVAFEHVAGAAQHALAARSPSDMLRIRNQIGEAFQSAAGEDSARRRRALLTIAVVGEDLAACHVALEVQSLLRTTTKHFPRVQPDEPGVVMIARRGPGPRDDRLRELSRMRMRREGIDVREAQVSSVDAEQVVFVPAGGSEQRIEARTTVWARREPLHPLVPAVDPMGAVEGMPGVFAIGDAAGSEGDPLLGGGAVASNAMAYVRGGNPSFATYKPRRFLLMGPRHGVARCFGTLVGGGFGRWLAHRRVAAIGRGGGPALALLNPAPTQLHVTAPPPAVAPPSH